MLQVEIKMEELAEEEEDLFNLEMVSGWVERGACVSYIDVCVPGAFHTLNTLISPSTSTHITHTLHTHPPVAAGSAGRAAGACKQTRSHDEPLLRVLRPQTAARIRRNPLGRCTGVSVLCCVVLCWFLLDRGGVMTLDTHAVPSC